MLALDVRRSTSIAVMVVGLSIVAPGVADARSSEVMESVWQLLRIRVVASFGFRVLGMSDRADSWCHFRHWLAGRPVQLGDGVCESLL